jgi:hypothetical protein
MSADHDADAWDRVTTLTTEPGGGLIELPESGWGALVGWLAGPAHLARRHDRIDQHATVVTIVDAAGERRSTHARTAAEQDEIDADIDGYLRDAGIPARPSGYRWFLRLPPGLREDQFWSGLNTALGESRPSPSHPRDTANAVREHLFQAYRMEPGAQFPPNSCRRRK